MLLLDTTMAASPDRIRQAVADIAEQGFDAIALEFRNCGFDEWDEIGQKALRTAEEEARKHGLGFVPILPWPGLRLLKRHPEARQTWIAEHGVFVRGGRFQVRLRELASAGHIETRPVFERIAKAFYVRREEGILREALDITDDLRDVSLMLTDEATLSGTYGRDGELLLYAAFSTDYPDYASPAMAEAIEESLARYEGLRPDGFALDEFGAGSKTEGVYLAGTAFLQAFRERYGYDFLDRIYWLQNDSGDGTAGKLRFDYYNLTMETTYRIQKLAKDRYEANYGAARFAGFHSTWWGEGNSGDLWAGNIDYFRLTDNLSGGFVDSQYDAERTMMSMTMLAESLAKYSGSGLAYNMCWDRKPTEGNMVYYHRLLACRGVRWVAHAYGNSGPFGPGYPHHPTWKTAGRCVAMHKAMQRFADGAVARPRVAVMYAWESVAYRNDPFMHYHRLSMKALLHKLMLRHIEADVVPSFEEDLARYDALIVLWPAMLPEAAWQRIRSYAKLAGKRLVFIGPPGTCTTEGRDIRGEFAELTGAEPAGGEREYPGEYEYVAWDLWFTGDRIPMRCAPLELRDGGEHTRMLIKHDGRLLGVRRGNVSCYAFELPLTPYFDSLLNELEAYRDLLLPPDALGRVALQGDASVLTLMPRFGSALNAAFEYAGRSIVIEGGGLIGLRFQGGRLTAAIGEEGATLFVDGELADYEKILYNR